MKNVFLVHSNTSLITTLAIIENEEIIKEDVLLFITRGFKTSLNYKKKDLHALFLKFENIGYYNFYKGYSGIKEVDRILNELIPQQFNIYLPHIAHPFFQVIATSEKCNRVNIIEEGVNCLSKRIYNNKTSFKFEVINILFNLSGLYGRKRYFRVRSNIDFGVIQKSLFPTFYGISPGAFNHVSNYSKFILDYKFPKILNRKRELKDYSQILVLEAIVEQGNLSKGVFKKSLDYILDELEGEKIFVKFHPAQKQENIDSIISMFKNKVELIVIPQSTILEFEFILGKGFKVHGFTSSLLHYANLFGHEVHYYYSQWLSDKKFLQFRSFNDFPLPSEK